MDRQTSTNRKQLLDELLRLVVKTWGYMAVVQRLNKLQDAEGPERVLGSNDKGRNRSLRRSARGYVEKLSLPANKRDMLLELASRFDDKRFLPTIGDIKSFLERKNLDTERLRARGAAIPKIVEILLALPDENLEKILKDDDYSGPSRLGPLSDAIKARGEIIRSVK